jgi:hypothetical protein
MSLFAPSTQVILCNVPIDRTQVNQIKFANVAAQTAYFKSKKIFDFSVTPQTFVRKDQYIKIDKNIDELFNVNYVMFDNYTIYSKWVYCFITRMEFVSEKCTKIYIETDVFQTWFLQCQFLPCFVSREHIAVDDIGKNLIDEGLETGEYIVNSAFYNNALKDLEYVVMTTTVNADDNDVYCQVANGIKSTVIYIKFNTDFELQHWITVMTSANKLSAILGIILIPKCLCGDFLPEYAGKHIFDVSHKSIDTEMININPDINGYFPKNGKLFQYPYNFLHVTTNNGTQNNYMWEYFTNALAVQFVIDGGVMPNPVVKLSPKNYKNLVTNRMEALTLSDYPQVPFVNDAFQAYLAGNGVGIAATLAGSTIGAVASGFLGNPIGVASGVLAIGSEIGQIYQHSTEPSQANGTPSGSANIGTGIQTYHFSRMSITSQRAKIIDDYLTMYGYKTQEVKIPNLEGRPIFNYVKTIAANITGAVPSEDMEKLKAVFNNGVTLWHNGNNVGHYEKDNRVGV